MNVSNPSLGESNEYESLTEPTDIVVGLQPIEKTINGRYIHMNIDSRKRIEERKKHQEKMNTYIQNVMSDFSSELFSWTHCSSFSLIKSFSGAKIQRNDILDSINGKENILLLFTTNTFFSFGVFSNSAIPLRPQQSLFNTKPQPTNSIMTANDFVFSLDNLSGFSFRCDNSQNIENKFITIYFEEETILEIGNFLTLYPKGKICFSQNLDNSVNDPKYVSFINLLTGSDQQQNYVERVSIYRLTPKQN